MTEWTVVGVLVTLIGLLAAIIKPITNLTKSITTLTVIVDGLREDMQSQKSSAHESHKRLWDHNAEQDKQLNDHEVRIARLEE